MFPYNHRHCSHSQNNGVGVSTFQEERKELQVRQWASKTDKTNFYSNPRKRKPWQWSLRRFPWLLEGWWDRKALPFWGGGPGDWWAGSTYTHLHESGPLFFKSSPGISHSPKLDNTDYGEPNNTVGGHKDITSPRNLREEKYEWRRI